MGLDVSHDAFSGAYSAFNRFRMGVLEATGGHETVEHGQHYFKFGPGYDSESHPGLFEFMSHSDCDGAISPEIAAKLADEMEALLPKLDAMGVGGVARKWIVGCRSAAAANEPLQFC